MKLTMENPRGTEISCGSPAAAGVFALEAKSGAFLQGIRVRIINAMLFNDIDTGYARYESGHVTDT